MKDKTKPLVSVVIPAYNAEKWIYECIDSVMKQDYPNIEIAVVDDASTDNTKQILLKILNSTHPCSMIISCHNQNMGECITSSDGFALTTGKYACRLSADDMFVNTNHITKQVEEMEKYNLDWCYNNINLVGRSLYDCKISETSWVPIPIRYSARFFYRFDNLFLKFSDVCYLIAIVRNPINSSALMIRKSTYDKYRLTWDNGYRTCGDSTLIADMFLHGLKVHAIHSIGSFYRIHPDQSTGKPDTNRDYKMIRECLYNEIKNNNNSLWIKITLQVIKRYAKWKNI